MESEKVMYWMTLSLLALAMTSGFVSKHRAWGDAMLNRSIEAASQASYMAANYAGIAGTMFGVKDSDFALPSQAMIQAQNSVACMQRTLVRRQAELARWQAMKVRVRALERVSRIDEWPSQEMVIEVPQPARTTDDTF